MNDPNSFKDKKSLFSGWTIWISFLIAAVFLYFAFKDAHFNEIWQTVLKAQIPILLLSLLLFSINQFFRGLRWRILLTAEKKIPVSSVFWANNIGYFGNNFLPARAGELIRSAAIGKIAGIGTGFSLATALVERVMDAAILVAISMAVIFSFSNFPDMVINAAKIMGAASLIGLVTLFFTPRMEKQIYWVVSKLPLNPKINTFLRDLIGRFLLGMRVLQNPARMLRFLGFSALIWTLDALIVVCIGLAFNISISMPVAFIIIAALGLSSAMPSTPGYLGIYQFAAIAVMTPFNYRNADILVFIITYQVLGYIGLGIWGGIGFWRLGWKTQGEYPYTH